jgi:serine/threonine-protein phosphatase 2A regulatory subunit A
VQVLERIKNPHYLYRMTVLVAISSLASIVSSDVLCNAMLPAVIGCSKDRVPNVKFNVAKMLEKIVPLVDQVVVDQTIRPCLAELTEDSDSDVRFYAKQAMYACDSMQAS